MHNSFWAFGAGRRPPRCSMLDFAILSCENDRIVVSWVVLKLVLLITAQLSPFSANSVRTICWSLLLPVLDSELPPVKGSHSQNRRNTMTWPKITRTWSALYPQDQEGCSPRIKQSIWGKGGALAGLKKWVNLRLCTLCSALLFWSSYFITLMSETIVKVHLLN